MLYQYDPKSIIITLVNTASSVSTIITGYAPDAFVEAKFNNNEIKAIRGCEGEVSRSASLDKSGLIILTLLLTSPSNAVLQTYRDLDKKNGTGIFSFQIKDLFGSSLIVCPSTWVMKVPTYNYSAKIDNRVWELECDFMSVSTGTPPVQASLSSGLKLIAADLRINL